MISVIIPVRNGEATLVKCLTAIKNQTIAENVEIIVLDTQSTDSSLRIAKTFGAKIIHILPSDFNHGLTRNLGTQHASRELLYFTVQDAYLAEENQLEKMAAHFTDEEVQAVVGMQATPHDQDKNPAKWFKRFSKPETVYRHFPEGSFGKMTLQEQFQHCSWDNVNAMYRKSALLEIPFIETDFAEDWLWVKDALTAKMKIAFDPSLVVYHYHHRGFSYSFKTQYIMNDSFFKYFKIYPALPAFVKPVLTDLYRIWKNNKISPKEKMYWSRHNILGSAGVFLSHFIFMIVGKLFGEKALAKSTRHFCAKVPQGKIKH